MAVLFSVFCLAASAEEAQVPQAECSLEDGLLVIRVPLDAEDGGAWAACLGEARRHHRVGMIVQNPGRLIFQRRLGFLFAS